MKSLVSGIFVFFMVCCGCLSAAVALDQIVDPSTNISFPRQVDFSSNGNEYHLQATGVATRVKKVVVNIKVYSIAHYLEDPSALAGNDKFQAILDSDQAKQLTLKFNRSVTAQQIQDSYRDSFQKEISQAEQAQMRPLVDSYLNVFTGGVQKGDEQVLRWLPDGRIEVILGGQLAGTFNNPRFARHLWSIWLGPNSIVDRKGLISLLQ